MRTSVLLAASSIAGASAGFGGDMRIEFPGMMVVPRATAGTGTNIQTFAQALGGTPAAPILSTGDAKEPFSVGTEQFTSLAAAVDRSCGNQHTACADAANSATGGGGGGGSKAATGVTVNECDAQQSDCVAAGKNLDVSGGTAASSSVVVGSSSVAATTSVSVASTSTFSAAGTLQSANDEFLFFCNGV